MKNDGQTIVNGDSVAGQPKTQLARAKSSEQPRQLCREEIDRWIAELAALRKACETGKTGLTVEQILKEDRAERDI
jgi:hypothetical protein